LKSDPSLLAGVDGLNPSEEKHGTVIILQPTLGAPMKVNTRAQLNLLIDETKFNTGIKKFDNTVLPVIWMEIVSICDSPLLLLLVINEKDSSALTIFSLYFCRQLKD
jgi:hypothetical protein